MMSMKGVKNSRRLAHGVTIIYLVSFLLVPAAARFTSTAALPGDHIFWAL